ncbi:MAG: hypothetical protein AAB038_00585 [Planctomycetota bacterium]
MRHIRIVIIFLSLPILLLAGGAPMLTSGAPRIPAGHRDASEGITYTIKPLLKQDGPTCFLSVNGATNLPDEALLDITFTYRFPGGDNERYLDYKRCLVTGAVYQVQLGPLKRKPPAGQYLFKVAFDPARQPDSVSKYLEGKYQALEFLAQTETLIVGQSTEEAGQERQRMLNIIKKEGLALKTIFDDIKAHAPEYSRAGRAAEPQSRRSGINSVPPAPTNVGDNFGDDIKTLQQWSKETTGKLESLVSVILLEDELRVFEMVTQAKAQIENSAFLLKHLLQKQDGILDLKEQPKDTAEFKRQLAIITEEVSGLSKLTEKEVTKNLKELGIFSLNKDVLLGSLGKIELIINKALENEPLKDADKSVIMQEVVALSRNLPDVFYDELHNLVSEVINVIKSNQPVDKKAKEGIIQRIKALRGRIEE